MLGGVGVDDVEAGVEVVDEDDRRTGGRSSASVDPLAVLGGGDLRRERRLDRVGQLRGVGDEDGGGQRVVLGLADQVGGDVPGSAVASARTAISVGPASASMPMTPLSSRLAAATQMLPGPVTRRHGHAVLVALGVAVGEHRDGLGAADRVHLVDAEQGAGGQDGRVGVAGELAVFSFCGGLATASEPTPATCAGTTFMTTLDG